MTATVADQLAFDALPVEVQALARRVFEPLDPTTLESLLVQAYGMGWSDRESGRYTVLSVGRAEIAVARLLAQGVGG